jgi:hypothetical protein
MGWHPESYGENTRSRGACDLLQPQPALDGIDPLTRQVDLRHSCVHRAPQLTTIPVMPAYALTVHGRGRPSARMTQSPAGTAAGSLPDKQGSAGG